jgi:hypothetical protein
VNELPFHRLLNEDHQHQRDRYNDGVVLVEHQCKQHGKAEKQNSIRLCSITFNDNLLDYEEMKSILQIVWHLELLLREIHNEHYQVRE